MHVLAVNSVSTLLNYLSEQLQNTPTLEQIQAFAEEAKQAADELKEDPETVLLLLLSEYTAYNSSENFKICFMIGIFFTPLSIILTF